MSFEEALVLIAGELTATIRVQDHRLSRLSLPQRHQYSLQHQLPILATTHRPADNKARVKIDDHAKMQPQTASETNVQRNVGRIRQALLGTTEKQGKEYLRPIKRGQVFTFDSSNGSHKKVNT